METNKTIVLFILVFTWLAFVNACLFLTMGTCLFAATNLFHLVLASELCWVSLYTLAAVFGVFIDEAGCFSLTFFILGFAAIELCFGLLLVLLMRHFKASLFLPMNQAKLGAKLFSQFNRAGINKPRL